MMRGVALLIPLAVAGCTLPGKRVAAPEDRKSVV